MPMIMPPKEILKNVRCRNNSVYLVGEVTEEQKKIFRKFKKEVENTFKKSRVETWPTSQNDTCFENKNWILQKASQYGKKYAQEHLQEMEKQAYRLESLYYHILKKRV